MADSNYYLFFKLYRSAPAMGAYLMDYCVDRLRKVALTIMTKVRFSLPSWRNIRCIGALDLRMVCYQAFRPLVPVSAVFEQLGFEDMPACEAFLTDPKLAKELSIEFTADRRAVKKK